MCQGRARGVAREGCECFEQDSRRGGQDKEKQPRGRSGSSGSSRRPWGPFCNQSLSQWHQQAWLGLVGGGVQSRPPAHWSFAEWGGGVLIGTTLRTVGSTFSACLGP